MSIARSIDGVQRDAGRHELGRGVDGGQDHHLRTAIGRDADVVHVQDAGR